MAYATPKIPTVTVMGQWGWFWLSCTLLVDFKAQMTYNNLMWLAKAKNNKQNTEVSGHNHLSKHPYILTVLSFEKKIGALNHGTESKTTLSVNKHD